MYRKPEGIGTCPLTANDEREYMARLILVLSFCCLVLAHSLVHGSDKDQQQKQIQQFARQVRQVPAQAAPPAAAKLPPWTINPREPDYMFSRIRAEASKGDTWIEARFRGNLEIRKREHFTIPLALQKDTLLESNLDEDAHLMFRNGYLCTVLRGKRTYELDYTVHIDAEEEKGPQGEQMFRFYIPVHTAGLFSIVLPDDYELYTQWPSVKKRSGENGSYIWRIFTSGAPVLTLAVAETRGEKKVRYSAEERMSLSITDDDRHSVTRKSIIKVSVYEKRASRFTVSIPDECTLSTIKTGFTCSKHIDGRTLVLVPSYPVAGEAFIMLEGIQPVVGGRVTVKPAAVTGALFQKGSISITGRPNISIADIRRDAVARSSAKSSNTSVYFYSSPDAQLTLGITPNPLRELWEVRTAISYSPEIIEGSAACRLQTDGGPVTSVELAVRAGALCADIRGKDIASWRIAEETLHIDFSREVNDTSFTVSFSAPSKRSGTLMLPGFVSDASRFSETVSVRSMSGYILTPVRLQEFKPAEPADIPVRNADKKKVQKAQKMSGHEAMLSFVSERAGTAEIRINRRRPLINGKVVCGFDVLTDTVRMNLQIRGTVSQKHIREMSLRIPSEYILDRITGGIVKGWDRSGDTITVRFTRSVLGGFSFECFFLKPFEGAPSVAFSKEYLPMFDRISAAVDISFSPFFKISSTNKLGMKAVSKNGRKLRYSGESGRMSCECVFSESPLKYETYAKNFLFIRHGKVEAEADLNVIVPSKPAHELTVVFPVPVSGSCEIRGRDVESCIEEKKGSAYRVRFKRPVTGRVSLSVTWIMEAEDRDRFRISFPGVEFSADNGGITALIKSDSGIEVLKVAPDYMTPADLGERGGSEEGLVNAFLYENGSKARMSFNVKTHATQETTPVTCSKLVCRSFKASSGYLTRVNAFLFNKSAQNIRMKLADGHTLAGTYINSVPVKPMLRKDAVIVPASAFRGRAFVFTAVYEHPADDMALPDLETAGVTEVTWDVMPGSDELLVPRGEFYTKLSRDVLPAPLYARLLSLVRRTAAAPYVPAVIVCALLGLVIYGSAKKYYRGLPLFRAFFTELKPVRTGVGLLILVILAAGVYMLLPTLSVQHMKCEVDRNVAEGACQTYKTPSYSPDLRRRDAEGSAFSDSSDSLRKAMIKSSEPPRPGAGGGGIGKQFSEIQRAEDIVEAEQFIAQADTNIQNAYRYRQKGMAEKKMDEIITQQRADTSAVHIPQPVLEDKKEEKEAGEMSKRETEQAFVNVQKALELDPDNDRALALFWNINGKIGNTRDKGGKILNTIKLRHFENKRNEEIIQKNLKKAEQYVQKGDMYNAGNYYNEALSLAKTQEINTQVNRDSLRRAKDGLKQVVHKSRMQGGKEIRKKVASRETARNGQDMFKAMRSLEPKSRKLKHAQNKPISEYERAGAAAEDLISDWESALVNVKKNDVPFLFGRERDMKDAISDIEISSDDWGRVSGVTAGVRNPTMFAWRRGGRHRAVGKFGGSVTTESSVETALQYLNRSQQPDGSWNDPQSSVSPFLETSTALLAYLGAGHTHKSGRYRVNVARGLSYLLKNQNADGSVGTYSEKRQTETAAACAAVLSETYGMTRENDFKNSAQRAVKYLISLQKKNGLWKKTAREKPDTYPVMCAVIALKNAKSAGLDIGNSFSKCLRGMKRFRTNTVQGYFPYNLSSTSPDRRASMYGILAMIFMGNRPESCVRAAAWAGQDVRTALANMNADFILAGTNVSFQMGGDVWKQWNGSFRDALTAKQIDYGRKKGAWPAAGLSRRMGTLYTTAVCAMSLEVYYRYLPVGISADADDIAEMPAPDEAVDENIGDPADRVSDPSPAQEGGTTMRGHDTADAPVSERMQRTTRKDETGIKAGVIRDFNIMKQKNTGCVIVAADRGMAAGVKPLRLTFEYPEQDMRSFRGSPRGGEIQPLTFTVMGHSLIERISLILLLLPLAALFAGQTWKITAVLACAGLAGILASVCTQNIVSYFTGHLSAGLIAALCISLAFTVVRSLKRT